MNFFSMMTKNMDIKKSIFGRFILVTLLVLAIFFIASISFAISAGLGVILMIAAIVGSIYVTLMFDQYALQLIVRKYDQEYSVQKRKLLLAVIGAIVLAIAYFIVYGILAFILGMLTAIPGIGWLFAIIAFITYILALYLYLIIQSATMCDYLVNGENFGDFFTNIGKAKEYFSLFKFDVLQYYLMIIVAIIFFIVGYILSLILMLALSSALKGVGLTIGVLIIIAFYVFFIFICTVLFVTLINVIVEKLRA